MAGRGRKGGTTTWWTVAAILAVAVFIVWWLSARRAEAPGLPANQPGARALSEPPDAHEHNEITHDEKADLDRIIRERGAPTP